MSLARKIQSGRLLPMRKILITGLAYTVCWRMRFKKTAPVDFAFSFLGHADFDLLNPAAHGATFGVNCNRKQSLTPLPTNLVDRCVNIERELSWAVNASGPRLPFVGASGVNDWFAVCNSTKCCAMSPGFSKSKSA